MNKPPAFQFYVGDWLSSWSISQMSAAQERAYLRLLLYQWDDPTGTLPADNRILAAMAKMSLEQWVSEEGRPVREKFTRHPKRKGRLFNQKLHSQWTSALAWRRSKSKLGRKGGLAKALNRSTSQAPAKQLLTSSSSSSSSSPPPKTATAQHPPPATAGEPSAAPVREPVKARDDSPEAILATLYRQIVQGPKGDCFTAKDTFRAALLRLPAAAIEAAIRDGANAGKKTWQIVQAAENAIRKNGSASGRGLSLSSDARAPFEEMNREPSIQI